MTAKQPTPQATPMTFASDCCGATVDTPDGHLPEYTCPACGKPCMAVPGQNADWDPFSKRWIPWPAASGKATGAGDKEN